MAMKAKHAFGALERVDENIKSGIIDSYDVLFVKDEEGKPYVGWVSKDGQKEIIDPYAGVSKLESQVETKLATKADAKDVNAQIAIAMSDSVSAANAYTNKVVEAAMEEHLTKKYEIASVPEGTLIKMSESEIRVMVPTNAVWTKQNVGVGGDASCYYMTFKTYVPNSNIVGYKEHLGNQSDSEILTDFHTDEFGRRYQPTWLALAKYNEANDTWAYYGANSDVSRYIGWDYKIDWYDANGVIVASDSIRINLSNEQCHSSIEPYYVGSMMKEVDTKIDTKIEEKIKEVESSYEIVEF